MLSFAAIGMKLLGLGKLLRAGWDWLTEKPVRVLVAVLLVACLVLVVMVQKRSAERDAEHAGAVKIQQAFDQTVENYQNAAEAAKQLQDLRNARVAREQAEINGSKLDDLQTRLADARAHAERLRQQLAQADRGGAGSAVLSAVSQAPGRAPEAPGDPRLPASGGAVAIAEMNLAERLTATEQAIQLDVLIDWIEAQVAIDVNAGPAGE